MNAGRTVGITSLLAASVLVAGTACAEPLLYVTHETAGTVSVIDTATGSLVRTLAVAGTYRDAPAVSPDGRRLFVVAG